MVPQFHPVSHSFDGMLGIRMWKASAPAERDTTFLVLPDGKADIVLVFDSAGGPVSRLSYTGFDLQANQVDLPGGSIFVGIQFDAATCLAAREIMASDRFLSTVIESVQRSVFRGGAFDATELQRLARSLYDPLVRTVIRRLERYPHRDQITVASSLAGVSTRTVERRFVESTGITPTDFIRVFRFLAFKRSLPGRDPDADFALRVGYSDQAHMCREVKRISSMTPRAFASRARN